MARKREVIGEQVSVHIADAPTADENCPKCGADPSAYEKHPALKGGRCTECGEIWLPGMTFGKPQPIYRDQISVTPTEDGGATIRFND